MFATFYEGFGIPVIEALSRNTNVLISNTASLPEIGEKYCLMTNPEDILEIAEKTNAIMKNGNLTVIDLEEWQKKWSWKRCAVETIETYQKAYI